MCPDSAIWAIFEKYWANFLTRLHLLLGTFFEKLIHLWAHFFLGSKLGTFLTDPSVVDIIKVARPYFTPQASRHTPLAVAHRNSRNYVADGVAYSL